VRAPLLAREWPAFVLAGACLGLALSNWLRPPPVVPAFGVVIAVGLLAIGVAHPLMPLVTLAICAALAGLWWGTLRLDAFDRSVLAPSIGRSADMRVVITGPARRTSFALRLPAEVRELEGRALRERVLLSLPLGRSPPQGAILELRGRLVAPRGPERGFDERGWLARRGVHVIVKASEGGRIVGRRGGIGGLADRIRRHVDRSLAPALSGERRAVVAGIVLGEDEGLSDDLRDDFRASGLYHLLAVSGQNVAFIAVGVFALAWFFRVHRLLAEVGVLAAIGGYVLAVGWQPSVVRAGVAGSLASLAWLASRPRDRWHCLALGALVLLVWTPASLLEPGFQLSFAAVAAIFVALPRMNRWLEGYPVPRRLGDGVAVSLACGVATAPILWLQFGAVPLYSVPANVFAVPVAAPLLGLGLGAAALHPFVPSAAAALGWLNGWLAAYLAACARFFGGLPYAQLSSGSALLAAVGVVATIGVLVWLARRSLLFATGLAGAVLLVAGFLLLDRPPPLPPPKGLRVVFLDVGQGDSALLQVARGAVLVDQGPPEARVARQLRSLGVRHLAALVLTHPQRDHVGGAADVLRRLKVDELIDPAIPSTSSFENDALVVARRGSVPLVTARAGAVYRLGRLVLRVLWPDGPGPPGDDPNNHAVVILASFGSTDVLLTADAESDVTGRIPIPPVEILKVAHHGSEDSGLAEQLEHLRPRVAVISVGAHNDYGHPRASTIAALDAVPGLRLYRTDQDGRVIVESDGTRITVRSER
jgi:competence protein ComEC